MSKRNQNRRSQNSGQGSRTSEYRQDPREWSPSTDVPTRGYGSSMREPSWGGHGSQGGWQGQQDWNNPNVFPGGSRQTQAGSWSQPSNSFGGEHSGSYSPYTSGSQGGGQHSSQFGPYGSTYGSQGGSQYGGSSGRYDGGGGYNGGSQYGSGSQYNGGGQYANREYGSGRQFGNDDGRDHHGSRDFGSSQYSNSPDYGGQRGSQRGGESSGSRSWGSPVHWSGSPSYSNQGFGYGGSEDHDHDRDMSCCGPHSGRGPKSYKRTDDRIEEDINERLSRHGLIDASDISVSVSDGVVTLTGQIDDRETKRMAEDLVEDATGVKQVNNQLRTRSGRTATSRDEESSSYSSSSSSRGSRDDEGPGRGGSRTEGKRS